jgi:hypothetical protein
MGLAMINVPHVLVAVVLQIAIALAVRTFTPGLSPAAWWIGAAAASGFYLARELTQAEYRWIERLGGGRRVNMPWWGQFDLRVWDAKSWLDWFLPTAVTAFLAYAMT